MFMESLESRSLMSASAFSTQVSADLSNVRTALLKFRYDILTNMATVSADRDALDADGLAKDAVLSPLFATVHNQSKVLQHTVIDDTLAESSAVVKDESVVVKELKRYASDDGNEAARTADRKQLRKDRVQLQDDELAGLNARLVTRESEINALSDQLDAITAALGTDSKASAKLRSDTTKFVTDAKSYLDVVNGDLESIVTARTQLIADFNASVSLTT
jgi:cytochrome c556